MELRSSLLFSRCYRAWAKDAYIPLIADAWKQIKRQRWTFRDLFRAQNTGICAHSAYSWRAFSPGCPHETHKAGKRGRMPVICCCCATASHYARTSAPPTPRTRCSPRSSRAATTSRGTRLRTRRSRRACSRPRAHASAARGRGGAGRCRNCDGGAIYSRPCLRKTSFLMYFRNKHIDQNI
mgnify:CR=1 FL=1